MHILQSQHAAHLCARRADAPSPVVPPVAAAAPPVSDASKWQAFVAERRRALVDSDAKDFTFRPHERVDVDLTQMRDAAILWAVRDMADAHISVGYKHARQIIFSRLDNHDGQVRDVYTGRVISTDTIPNVDETGINTEHTWPRSHGLHGTPAISDMHHLFPSDADANSKRSSYPFGVVRLAKWEENGAKLGFDEWGEMVFEPPDEHKGNVARALFYVSAGYCMEIDDREEEVLRAWHKADPVDAAERQRNDDIAGVQGFGNPFVEQPGLVGLVRDFTDWI